MRRTLTVLAVASSLVLLGACSQVEDAAKRAVSKVECGATTKLAEQLPQGDDLDEATIARGASLARRLDSVLGRIPGDRVPATITDAISTASTDLDEAARIYDADPTAAKAKAAEAVAAVRTAVTDATTDLGC